MGSPEMSCSINSHALNEKSFISKAICFHNLIMQRPASLAEKVTLSRANSVVMPQVVFFLAALAALSLVVVVVPP